MSAPASTTDASSDVVGLLGDLIVSNDLAPGDRLPSIRELALQFGVKAGAVRDALLAAQGQGMVKVLPRKGAIVQDASRWGRMATHIERDFEEAMNHQDPNLFHVLDTRETLELTIVARAAQRRELPDLFQLRQILQQMSVIPLRDETTQYAELDVQFHLEIARLSGNSVMMSLLKILLQELKPHLDRIRWSENRREKSNHSHMRVYSALVAGDPEQARNEMREHIRTAYNSLLDELRDPPSMNGVPS